MFSIKKWYCIEPGNGFSQGLQTGFIVSSGLKPDIPNSEWREATDKDLKEFQIMLLKPRLQSK